MQRSGERREDIDGVIRRLNTHTHTPPGAFETLVFLVFLKRSWECHDSDL